MADGASTETPSAPQVEAANTKPEDLATELAAKSAAATQHYALKNYTAAADLYSEAAALQAQINGEMNPENADLLYSYGRCLYHVAVSRSDVLGGKVAGQKSDGEKRGKKRKHDEGAGARATEAKEDAVGEAVIEQAIERKEGDHPAEPVQKKADTPYFQIEGDDADWNDSDEDEDEDEDAEAADGEAEEDEDDFATAFEILDTARVLLEKKFNMAKDQESSSKETETQSLRTLKDRLADTHDLQAEISLENERFNDAIPDFRASLALKEELYPPESSIIAEAHFKLSLALEFASVTSTKDAVDGSESKQIASIDEEMRAEAASHMETAISATKQRVGAEKKALRSLQGEEAEKKKKEIDDVNEIIQDMEIRLEDLRKPAVSLSAAAGPASADENPLGGILGSLLGESPAEAKRRIEEATKGANDLTGLLKKKPKTQGVAKQEVPVLNGHGKRKAEDAAEIGSKKAKVEDEPE